MFKKILLIMLLLATTIFASEIKWSKDYHSGLKEAKQANKPMLFVSSRHTCKYCVMLDETTFKDARVIKELNKDFISVTSYSDENDYLPRELRTPGTPAIWFLLPSGEPMYQPLMGMMQAGDFLKALAIVREDFKKEKGK